MIRKQWLVLVIKYAPDGWAEPEIFNEPHPRYPMTAEDNIHTTPSL